ncbi:MAG TPA: sensor histidine kinase [Puia sp.]|jgi:two-component sensor histidine kinase|nr:sensor histidine kinase [Puia sp.]
MRKTSIPIFRAGIVVVLLAICNIVASAQFYPRPAAVSQSRQAELLAKLSASLPDTNKVRVLLDLINLYFNKPFRIRANFDIALRYARQAGELSAKLRYTTGYNTAQLYMADIFAHTEEILSAEALLDKVGDTAKVDLLLLLSFHYWWDDFRDPTQAYEKALKYAGQARDLSGKLQLKEKELFSLAGIAAVHIVQDKSSLAESELQAVVSRMRAIRDPDLQYAYYLLSFLYQEKANFDKALYYALESIKSMSAAQDTSRAGDLYCNLAIVYKYVGEYQLCIDNAKRAIAIYTIHGGEYSFFHPVKIINAILTRLRKNDEAYAFLQETFKRYQPQNYSDSFIVANTWDGYYTAIKRHDMAIKLQLELLDLAKRKNLVTALNYQGVGGAYIQDHQYAKAKPYLLKALNASDAYPTINVKSMLNYFLFLCDSAAGDYVSAIRHLNINKKLDDSIASIERTRAVQQIKIEMETQKKEDEIKAKDQNITLLTQRNEIQRADLSKSKMIRDITISGILVLLLGGGLLYWQYRQKQRASALIVQQNYMLEKLVTEKEWLLKESHHRVKNNLHSIICLLESQAYYLENDALRVIETTQHRIYAMSLIHQKVYQSEDISTLEMGSYLSEFVDYIRESFGSPEHIHFNLAIDEVRLDIAKAIPIALIVNEAITNCIKYAFPGRREGQISVELQQEGGKIRLCVADNGIGIDPAIDIAELNSLGVRLMKGLSEDLRGKLIFQIHKGTRVEVFFEQ